MKEKAKIAGLLAGCILLFSLVYAQTEPSPTDKGPDVTVLGRLGLEKHGEEEWLVLHSKEAETYLVIGNLREKLKNYLIELGQNNLVSVIGKGDKEGSPAVISCKNKYGFDRKGEKIIDSQCIRYYNLEVVQIAEAKKSDEEIPPPKRDTAEEAKAKKLASAQFKKEGLTQIVEIQGTISKLNLRFPIKTIEIKHRDKDNQEIKSVLLIGPNTTIAKRSDVADKEPMHLSRNALRVGQEVNVVYSRSELKSEALFITITKE